MASNFTEQYGIVSIPDEVVADIEMVLVFNEFNNPGITHTHKEAQRASNRLQTFLQELKAQNNE